MFKILKIGLIVSISMLIGCAANGIPQGYHEQTPYGLEDKVEKVFIGVPLLLGLEGSSVYLERGWYLTVKHNKYILEGTKEDIYYHPTCDIALYKGEVKEVNTKVGTIQQGNILYHLGYPIGLPLVSHKGVYLGEIIEPNGVCIYSASNAVVIGGLSGGGVFNQKGELVGVTVGYMKTNAEWANTSQKDPSIFIPLLRVKDWINIVIKGELYYE